MHGRGKDVSLFTRSRDSQRHIRSVVACMVEGLFLLASTPALSQVDLSGHWAQKIHEDTAERNKGPAIGDYSGLPINEAARMRADTWDAAKWSVPEHQCEPHPADYAPHGPASVRIWSEVDPITQDVIAWHVVFMFMTSHQTIWMDGRPHPPKEAAHTWMGFTTGKWEGDTLVSTTTHLKEGWLRRNGVPRSDKATLTEYWIRHDNYLTVVAVIEDPVYLTAPLIRSWDWTLSLGFQIAPFNCVYRNDSGLPKGYVAHHLPGENPGLEESRSKLKLPLEAMLGGKQTMYPQFASHLRSLDRKSAESAARSVIGVPAQSGLDEETHSQNTEVHILPVQGKVYLLSGAGGNVTVQAGSEGVLVVDSGASKMSGKVLGAIRQISERPIRHIINTSADADHVGGNAKIAEAGKVINSFTGSTSHYAPTDAAPIYSHENVLRALSATNDPAYPPAAWPTDTFFTDSLELTFNGEAIQVLHQPAAHSDGDSVVYFRSSNVISTGDIFDTTSYPTVDTKRGGSIRGLIEALNRIIDITIPATNQEGGTIVVPGKGRLCDEYDVVMYRDMVTMVRDRVRRLIQTGMTLERIQVTRPTLDYDGRYGAEAGRAFVAAIYESLKSESTDEKTN